MNGVASEGRNVCRNFHTIISRNSRPWKRYGLTKQGNDMHLSFGENVHTQSEVETDFKKTWPLWSMSDIKMPPEACYLVSSEWLHSIRVT